MPLYVDSNNELWEFDPKDTSELDQLAREGFTPAGETDIERHNTAVDVQQAEASSSFGSTLASGAERTLSRGIAGALNLAAPVVKAMNPGIDFSTMPDNFTPEMVAPRRTAPTADSPTGDSVAFSEHEQLAAKARPFAAGLGQAVAASPFAMAAGSLAAPGLAAGAGLAARAGAAAISAGTEALAEAVPQEYEDAWLQHRAPTLKGVAENTLFFAGADLGLRGVIGLGGHLLGRRSALAEASGRAARADSKVGKSNLREARSVGAAAATKDEATQAIESLSDHDAVILDRDAGDYTKLAAVSATDAMNRVQEGFENELSYASKTSDWQAGADLWTTKNTKAQNSEWEALTKKRQALDEEIKSGGRYGYDFGAQGSKLREINDHYAALWEKAEGAERNTVMDQYKRSLDKHIMRVAGARNLDEGVKNKLVELIEPYADDLRKGLTNRKIWGRNADLQRDTNKGWEQLLKHWKVIQKKLYEETGVVHFADTSGTRRQMQATTERMYAAMTKNPVLQREFLEHYEGALDGIEMMTEARRAWTLGPVQKLDELHDSLRTLAKDWNLSSVIGAAQARVEHLKKSPGTFTKLAAGIALQQAPFGIGPAVQALGKYLEHTRIKKGTPLASLLEGELRRYGKHPILSDARVAADFAPWMRDALREAGAPIAPTPRPPKGAPAAAASAAAEDAGPGLGEQVGEFAKEHGSKVAGAGLFGLAASQQDDEGGEGVAAGLGILALPMFLMKGGKKPLSALMAVRALKKAATERGVAIGNGYAAHDIARGLFEYAGSDIAEYLKYAEREGIDLAAKGAAVDFRRLAERTPFINNTLASHARAPHPELTAATTAAREGSAMKAAANPRTQEARALLGKFGETIDGTFDRDWVDTNWQGTTVKTYARDGEPTQAVLKRRLKDKSPLTVDEVGRELFGINTDLSPKLEGEWEWDPVKATSVRVNAAGAAERAAYIQGKRELLQQETAGLRSKVDSAIAALGGEPDKIAKVDAEDSVIRGVLRDAVGMRPEKARKALPTHVDATSRYRAAKRGFDAWGRKALPEKEYASFREWQSMRYRAINADVRGGKMGSRKAAEEMATEWQKQGKSQVGEFEKDIASFAKPAREQGARLITAMNKAIDAGKTVPGRVRRGISMPEAEIEKLLNAGTVTSQGFMSTSVHDTTPRGFAERRAKELREVPVMLEVEQHTGLPIGQGEGELTLRPGTKFSVKWARRESDGWVTAYLVESEPSKVTAADILKGLAGKIPTEATIAGGLLGLGAATAADDADAADAAEPDDHTTEQATEQPAEPAEQGLPNLSLFDAPGRPVQQEPVTASLAHARALKDIDTAASTVLTSRARQLLGTKKPPPSRGVLATLARRGQSPGVALEEVRDKLAALEGDPAQLMRNVADNLGDLPRTHPTVYTAIAQQLAKVTGYLQREIPRPKGRSLLTPEGTPPDTGEVLEFAAKYSGALDPDGALRDMARGEALPQQVASFRENWPDKYQAYRLRVLGELSAMGEKKKTMPVERMARLDEYLELDGASNRALSWAVADAMTRAREQTTLNGRPPAQATGASPATSTQFQTRAAAAATERGMV